MCAEFFGCFKKKRSDFFDKSIIQSAQEDSDIRELYFQNDVEWMDHVGKMNQNFVRKSVKEVIENIQKLSGRQDSEELRALFGASIYVLSEVYK